MNDMNVHICVIDEGNGTNHFYAGRNKDQLTVKVFNGYVKPNWNRIFRGEPIPTNLAGISEAIDNCYELDDCTYWWWGEAEL